MATQAPSNMRRLTSERHTALSLPPRAMHGQAPYGWEDVFGDGRSDTRIALASPANVVLTRITPDVSKALLRSVLVSPVGIAVPTSLPAGDRRDAGPCVTNADVRGDGLAKECVEQLPMHIVHPWFFHRTVTLVSSVGVLMVTCCLVP